MSGGGGEEVEVGILEKRARIQDLYEQVLLNHPSLPPLRDFQVASISALYIPHKAQYGQCQADIIAKNLKIAVIPIPHP